MSGLLDILEKMKVRPGMYIGKSSVSDLFVFVDVKQESAIAPKSDRSLAL